MGLTKLLFSDQEGIFPIEPNWPWSSGLLGFCLFFGFGLFFLPSSQCHGSTVGLDVTGLEKLPLRKVRLSGSSQLAGHK